MVLNSDASVTAAIALVVGLLLGTTADAKEAVVVTTTGQTLRGELVSETPETITLSIAGIQTPIPRERVREMTFAQSIEEQYAERRAKIADDDYDERYSLAYWLFENDAYGMALSELRPLERVLPDDDRIGRLLALIESKQQLEADAAAAPPPPARPRPDETPGDANGGNAAMPGEAQDRPALLTSDQINKIRLWELPTDLMKAKPNVSVPRDTIDKLFADYATNPAVPKGKAAQRAFRGKRGYEQLNLIFHIRARDLYDEVVILDDPAALIDFRREINPNYVARYFRQHFGSGQLPGFQLLGQRPNALDEVYTNFYLLSTATQNGKPMIDRASPEQSLLLQWGLPREFAAHPAPEVEGWRPFFSGPDDPNFKRYARWIDSLYDRPDYGIRYNPEAPDPSAPSTEAEPAADAG